MAGFFKNPVNLVWTLLACLTGVAWMIGDSYQPGDIDGAKSFSATLMVLAFFKVRLVLMHFMEVKIAPLALRLIVELYVVGVCAMVLVMYFRPPNFSG